MGEDTTREENTVYNTIEFLAVKKKELVIYVVAEFNGKITSAYHRIKLGEKLTISQPIDLDTKELKLILKDTKGG